MISEPTIPARLAAVHAADSTSEPQLIIDLRGDEPTVSIDPAGYRYEGAIPADHYYGFERVYEVSTGGNGPVDWLSFEEYFNSDEFKPLTDRIIAGAERHWNGSNTVIRLSEDAQEAEAELQQRLAAVTPLPNPSGCAGYWKAEDWFAEAGAHLGIGPDTTDEELATIAQREQDAADSDGVVIGDCAAFLGQVRDELRSEAAA